MGFGLVCLGYLMQFADVMGGGLIGYPLIAFGLWKASSVEKHFKLAALFALLMIPYSALEVLLALKIVAETSQLYEICYVVFLLVLAALHTVMFGTIRVVARDCNAPKLASAATFRVGLNLTFTFFELLLVFFPALLGGPLAVVLTVFKYIIIAVNLWLLYDCYAKITTPQAEEENTRALRNIDEKERARKAKREERDKK